LLEAKAEVLRLNRVEDNLVKVEAEVEAARRSFAIELQCMMEERDNLAKVIRNHIAADLPRLAEMDAALAGLEGSSP
jgi:DNA repair ATPase RecN